MRILKILVFVIVSLLLTTCAAQPEPITMTMTELSAIMLETEPATEAIVTDITIQDEIYDTSLTELYLSGRSLTNADIEPLKYMVNLTILDLSENQITDISPLANLTNLTDLILNSNQIIELNPISELTNLKRLRLVFVPITDLAPLKDLINLTFLYLQDNKINDIEPLSGLMGLTVLWLGYNNINSLSPLNGLTNLREVYLAEGIFSEVDIEALKSALPDTSVLLERPFGAWVW